MREPCHEGECPRREEQARQLPTVLRRARSNLGPEGGRRAVSPASVAQIRPGKLRVPWGRRLSPRTSPALVRPRTCPEVRGRSPKPGAARDPLLEGPRPAWTALSRVFGAGLRTLVGVLRPFLAVANGVASGFGSGLGSRVAVTRPAEALLSSKSRPAAGRRTDGGRATPKRRPHSLLRGPAEPRSWRLSLSCPPPRPPLLFKGREEAFCATAWSRQCLDSVPPPGVGAAWTWRCLSQPRRRHDSAPPPQAGFCSAFTWRRSLVSALRGLGTT